MDFKKWRLAAFIWIRTGTNAKRALVSLAMKIFPHKINRLRKRQQTSKENLSHFDLVCSWVSLQN
jgi:hypothetical protein